jgi:phosphoglycolate phosphatase
LEKTGVIHYFHTIVGRDQLPALKPDSCGVEYVLRQYPHIPRQNWLLVGDSWIDGMAAKEAGIQFLAYKGNEHELNEKNVPYIGNLSHIHQLLPYLKK